jgi:hypothetical protein
MLPYKHMHRYLHNMGKLHLYLRRQKTVKSCRMARQEASFVRLRTQTLIGNGIVLFEKIEGL